MEGCFHHRMKRNLFDILFSVHKFKLKSQNIIFFPTNSVYTSQFWEKMSKLWDKTLDFFKKTDIIPYKSSVSSCKSDYLTILSLYFAVIILLSQKRTAKVKIVKYKVAIRSQESLNWVNTAFVSFIVIFMETSFHSCQTLPYKTWHQKDFFKDIAYFFKKLKSSD